MTQYLEFIGAALGILAVLVPFIWKCIIKPICTLYKNHFVLLRSVEDIKSELTTNGGSSIKDTVNRIDRRQIMIDKRSKAIFYNIKNAILEVDQDGNILWANEAFHNIFKSKNLNRLDWISIIDEPKREEFLNEFKSCSKTNRELDFKTISKDGKVIYFSGFPYRDNDKNYGFLIYLKGE
jgi:PAS domain S-box-containing protein